MPSSSSIAELWHRAARLGHVPSMANYAVGNAFQLRDTLDNLAALSTYRRDAASMARKAAKAGNANALLALASAYSPESQEGPRTLLAQAVQTDVQESLTLYFQAKHSLQGLPKREDGLAEYTLSKIAALTAVASQAQLASAREEAYSRIRSWRPLEISGDMSLASLQRGRFPPIGPSDCNMSFQSNGG